MKQDKVNDRSIGITRLSLRRDYLKALKRGVHTQELKQHLKDKDNDSKGILIGSSIPAAISISVGSLGFATLCLSSIANVIGKGVNPDFNTLNGVINTSRDVVKTMGTQSIVNLCLPALTAFAMKLRLSQKTEKYTNNKFYTKKEIKNVQDIETGMRFIDALSNTDDKTADFGREFLSGVDISHNNREYNRDLLLKLASHREELLKKSRGEGTNEDIKEKLDDFLEFLDKSRPSDGASLDFLTSETVSNYIKKDLNKELKK